MGYALDVLRLLRVFAPSTLERMKFLDVPMSGSREAQTFSRNRFGQYVRTRAIPVNPNSTAQAQARARFSVNTAAWRALTDAQRAGWESLGLQMSRTDSLGQAYTLNGQQAYISVNNNRLDAGDAVVSDAPSLVTPSAPTSITYTCQDDSQSVAYTPTPLGAGQRLFVYASPQRSAGRVFEGDLRLIHVSAAAAASPADILTAYTNRFGVPVVGNRIFLSCHVYDSGFLSGPTLSTGVVST